MHFSKLALDPQLTPAERAFVALHGAKTVDDDESVLLSGSAVGAVSGEGTVSSGRAGKPGPMTANVVRRHGRPRSHVKAVEAIAPIEESHAV